VATLWVRLDPTWYSNPKFMMLAADKKWRAIAVYMAGLGYSGGQGLDGFIPYYALPMILGTQREVDELLGMNLWHACEGGWQVNDWNEYQLSSEESERRSKKARDAAFARWHGQNGRR
jgi:hypothetical protein